MIAYNKYLPFDIIFLRHLFEDIKDFLILPDRGKRTFATGHSLQLPFLSYADCDFQDVAAALEEMIGMNYKLPEKDKKVKGDTKNV